MKAMSLPKPLVADVRQLIDAARQPPRETLQAKLHHAIELARQKLQQSPAPHAPRIPS